MWFWFEFDLLPKSGMASLVCVITRRINRDNTVCDTNIVTPAKKNYTQKKKKNKNREREIGWFVVNAFAIVV